MHGGVIDRECVAALGLGGVHRAVGGPQRLSAADHLATKRGDADRGGRCRGATEINAATAGANAVDELARNGCGIGAVQARQQHGELVAAEPGDRVAVAQGLAQIAGNAHEQGVAGIVAEHVVDRLEVIEVDHHHDAGAAVQGCRLGVRVDGLLKGTTVGNPRQRIVIGEVAELLFEADALTDVEDLSEEELADAAGLVGQQ